MAGYLIAEEGPLTGLIIKFEEGTEWVLGRDPQSSTFALEDPMVSRKHVICHLTTEGFTLENLSAVNPATQNGSIITEPVLLQEGDIIQIGNTFFHFSEKAPLSESPLSPLIVEDIPQEIPSLDIVNLPDTKWILKVVTGPNAGAEFQMHKNTEYVIGKDPTSCDIIFQDLSVSRQHAKLALDGEEHLSIQDLGSRNGTFVNGELISDKKELSSQDMIVMGTTSFVVVNRELPQETIISAPVIASQPEPASSISTETPKEEPAALNIRDMIISKQQLVVGGVLSFVLLMSIIGMLALFQGSPLPKVAKHEGEKIEAVIKIYPDVQFSYNEGSGKVFLTGHVLTGIEKQELLYQLHGLSFLQDIEDAVVIDELVWQNMNALIITNPAWQGVAIYATAPGRFAIRGYLKTVEEAQNLTDYLNMNFPYLDRLDNQITVENLLATQIESSLMEQGFNNVTYDLANGEVVLSGRIDGKEASKFDALVREFKAIRGVRLLKNYVIYTTEDSSLVDLSTKYKVLGYSKKDGENHYIVINGKILTMGDTLDGMVITSIQTNTVLLEKDGLKFKINYNLQ